LPEKKLFREVKRTVDKAQAPQYLNELSLDAKLYRRIVDPSSYDWSAPQRTIRRALLAVGLFRVVQSVPTLLAILRAYEAGRLTTKQARHIARTLENFHVQFTAVTAQRTGGGTAQMFALAARSLEKARTKNEAAQALKEFVGKLRARLPSRDEFVAGFDDIHYLEESAKQRGLVRYLLARFDESERKAAVIDYEAMTVEHLAPQNPGPVDGTSLSPAVVGCMGNLVLVPHELNARLAAKPFLQKREALIAADVPLDDIVKNAKQWTKKEIDARTKAMARAAQERVFVV
jgi:hypothetical protein